jgi:hypothetical protein
MRHPSSLHSAFAKLLLPAKQKNCHGPQERAIQLGSAN